MRRKRTAHVSRPNSKELDEARKLLQDRDRENAKRIKEVEGLQASLRGANEALERRELEVKAEITRAKAALESEAHRSSALAKDLAKVSRNFESSQAEAEAARRQGQDREKELNAQFAKAHRAFGEEKEKVGRLEAEILGRR